MCLAMRESNTHIQHCCPHLRAILRIGRRHVRVLGSVLGSPAGGGSVLEHELETGAGAGAEQLLGVLIEAVVAQTAAAHREGADVKR